MFLCHDRNVPLRNRDWPRKEILCRDRHALSRRKELLVRQFHVALENGGSRRFSVATRLFMSRQRLS